MFASTIVGAWGHACRCEDVRRGGGISSSVADGKKKITREPGAVVTHTYTHTHTFTLSRHVIDRRPPRGSITLLTVTSDPRTPSEAKRSRRRGPVCKKTTGACGLGYSRKTLAGRLATTRRIRDEDTTAREREGAKVGVKTSFPPSVVVHTRSPPS
ncbi:hypothetical protein CDEST_00713 [Colletotrichum destructivum]|uniref:Secreted protein n=1 Tax=Colletotrichum destructivum TaxID=34406 RepID=A0AAX4HYA6_9PEZI|nr:hypothetical protein CDEST_00713 [Colletotrichum destructivum]